MGEPDKTMSQSYIRAKKKTNLKSKRKMEIIVYDEDDSYIEISSEQLDMINNKLKIIFDKYYSCDASIERIMSRKLFELLEIKFLKFKK